MNAEEIEKFLGLSKGAFNHIPVYARNAALSAIAKVRELEEQNLFRPGLYYIALIDLSASTVASAHLSPEINKRRIETFITATVEALGSIELKNYAQFVKEIGDASLFLFSSFDDLYRWWRATHSAFEAYNQDWKDELEDKEWPFFKLDAKTVVHLGEVSFAEQKNPVALAVNQVFKIEKLFAPGELGATDAVRQAATPGLLSHKLSPIRHVEVTLPGDSEVTYTWKLAQWVSS